MQVSSIIPSGFISQQDAAPAHTAKFAQDWIASSCSEFIGKDECSSDSPDVNLLIVTSGVRYKTFISSQKKH